ncbi:MAG: FAD-dependent oxidoreductase, partial [Candidatus Nanopelagicales bacterium]
ASEPWFASALPAEAGFAHFVDGPSGYQDGWQMRLPIIEPACYLPALVRRLESMGGNMTRMVVTALPDDALVVNCTGLASRALAHDESLTPVRGQVVRLSRVPNVDAWLLDQTDPTNPVYVVPRSEDIVVGGTAQANNFDSHPNDVDVGEIVVRASRLIPALADATVLSTAAALRPTRPQVRLELERRASGGYVVHNYGHGGAGWTIAWGCADEVVGLLQQVGAEATGLPV